MLVDAPLIELVEAAQVGELSASDELVKRYHRHVFATIVGIVGDAQLAEDLTQEAFVLGFQKLGNLRNPQLFAAWMRRIARNLSLDWLRRDRSQSQIGRDDLDRTQFIELESPGQSPSERVEKWEMTRVLLRGISRLPDKYRQPLIMCYFEGVSYSKIAERIDVPLGSVKTLIRTGKEKLKAVIGDLDATAAEVTDLRTATSKLVILSDKNRGQVVDLDGDDYLVGRHPLCQVRFTDSTVSGRHCQLTRLETGAYVVRDLGSTNGTWLNSQPVEEAVLQNSDVLQIGCLEIIFDCDNGPLTSALTTQTGIVLSEAVLNELDAGDLPPGRRTASLGRVTIVNGRPQFVPA